jgi:DUF4097 and DUF4098 domain-containing protein YvlB
MEKEVSDYIYIGLNTIYDWISSTSLKTNELICYGSQEKRKFYEFNIESIKETFKKLNNSQNPNLKVWIIVKDNDGKMECHLDALETNSSLRKLWEQSALELKCRDKEFIEKCILALESCRDINECNNFLNGIFILAKKYKFEKKYRHYDFFNDLYKILSDKIENNISI